MFKRDTTIPINQLFSSPFRTAEHSSKLLPLAAMILVGLTAAWTVLAQSFVLAECIGVVAGAIGIYWAVNFTTRHHEWVVLAILLIFAVIGFSIFSEDIRSPLHYALLAFFCIPLIPTARHSGILREGGYRLYAYYLAFAAFTVLYSIARAFSLARVIEASIVVVALAAVAADLDDGEQVDRIFSHCFLGCALVTGVMVFSLVALPHSLCWVSPEASYDADVLAKMRQIGASVDGIERFQALFNGPNDIGFWMLVTVGIGLARWPRTRGRERGVVAAVILGAVICGALADSRSSFIALAVGGTMYVAWRSRLRGLLWLGAGALCAIGVLALTGFDFSAYIDRGDVATLTGRTDMWMFVLHAIEEHPLLGWGYSVGGAIFGSRYFPLWWGPWDLGPRVSVHNGYLALAEGVGIPMAIFWLYVMLRPWMFALRQASDDWHLKRLFFLLIIPILILNLSEVVADDAISMIGFVFALTWVIAERYRLVECARCRVEVAQARATLPRAIVALIPGS